MIHQNSWGTNIKSELNFSLYILHLVYIKVGGWSGGVKVLGKLPVPGRPTILNTVGQGPTALAVGAGGGCLDIFTLIYPFSSPYRLKYCLKGPLNPKQPTIYIKVTEHWTDTKLTKHGKVCCQHCRMILIGKCFIMETYTGYKPRSTILHGSQLWFSTSPLFQ